MTELEQQLTNALTALSKQYEMEMKQQAEWAGLAPSTLDSNVPAGSR